MTKKLISILMILMLLTSCACTALADEMPQYEVTMLNAWKGSSAGFPSDQVNNDCAKFVREKFGLTFTVSDSGSEVSESEFINNLVMADALPDVINSAYWNSNVNGQGWQRVEAAKQGMFKDLTPYLADYPNLNAAIGQHLSSDVRRFLIYNEEFNGAMYFIPVQVNANGPELATVYGDTVYARKDVLETLNVKAEDIKTMDDVYELMLKVKEAGLKSWTGRDMIPMGLNSGAWRIANTYDWVNGNNISSFRLTEDGKVVHYVMTDYLSTRIKYVQKMLQNGLLDPEGFSITSEDAFARITQGAYALMPIDANAATSYYFDYTREEHPEAEWVPLNLTNKDGNKTVDVFASGWTGGHMTYFSAKIDEGKLRALLSFMDWMTTEEGTLFQKYGVEGLHYDMVDGKPVAREEYADTSSDAYREAGIGFFQKFWVLDNFDSLFPRTAEEMTEKEAYRLALDNQFRPRVEVDKLSVDVLLKSWDKYTDYNDKVNAYDLGTVIERAYYFQTEEEVDALVAQIQKDFASFGADEAAQYIQDNMTDQYGF